MAELLSLPDELLLAIANEMQGDIRNAYRSLRSLALSCRRLRPIAQEVLYMDVAICRTQSLRGPNSLTCLVQTLVQRPGLAVKVNKLNLRIIGNPIMHSKDCLELMYTEYEGCTCGFKPVLSLCIETIGNIRANNGSRLYNHDWASNIQAGLQLAMVGLILCLTPHLESLTLDYRKQKMESSGFYTKPIAFEHFSLDDLFGSVTQSPAFSIEHIKGFAKLTRLITNTCPPSKLISLPQLKGLEIGLLNDHWNQDRGLRPLLSTGTALSMTMTHLTVRLDKLALYSDRAILVRGVYRRLNDIIKNLTVLEYLFLQFGSEWGKRFDPRQGDLSEASFEYVTSEIESLSLTHLALDVEDVGKAWFYESGETPFEVIRPMTSLRRLPKLRSITAPEEAFFFPGGFETCVIPSTIESIGIISATYGTYQFIRYILSDQGQWPSLTSIKLETGQDNPGLYNNIHPQMYDEDDVSEAFYYLCGCKGECRCKYDSDHECECECEYHCEVDCESEEGCDHCYRIHAWYCDNTRWREFFKQDRAIFLGSKNIDVCIEIVQEKLAWREEWTG